MFSDLIKCRIVFRMPKSSIKEALLITVVMCSYEHYRRAWMPSGSTGALNNNSAVTHLNTPTAEPSIRSESVFLIKVFVVALN